MKNTLYILLTIVIFNFSYSQDVFFGQVGDEVIYLDDFLSIYNKNKLPDDTIINPNDIDEYLDLFIKFKLKVVEAKSLGMDTLSSFERELQGYRRQLAKSYLTDNVVTDQLLLESYERLKQEVNVSHILIKLDPGASSEDTLLAFNKAKSIQKEANDNINFAALAKKYSDDPSVEKNDGDLGYFSALYMVYPFENAAYQTKVGKISDPIRTQFGYHILKVNDKRASRGEVKVAHIMISVNPKNNSDSIAEQKIQEIYDLLVEGNDFENLVKKYSDDKKSASNLGELDWFGSNKMYKTFEEAAFNLKSPGDFSLPIKTPAGWHIIKLLDKKSLPPYEEVKSSLKSRVENDSRSQKSRDSLMKRLKEEYSFFEQKSSLSIFYNLIDENFFNNDIKSSDLIQGTDLTLFTLSFQGEKTIFSQMDFAEFLISFKRNFRTKENIEMIIDKLYETFVEQKILSFEDQNLELKYDEFRLLINEYHDGILLFELMDQTVWSKASQDTVGLNSFFESNVDNYLYPERTLTKVYLCNTDNLKKVKKNILKGHSDDRLLNKFNKNSVLNLTIRDSVFYSKEDESILYDALHEKEKGDIMLSISTESSTVEIIKIIDFLKPSPKPFKEVKGLVISDYQKLLEQDWLDILKQKYTVLINEELLYALKNNNIKKYLEKIEPKEEKNNKNNKMNFEETFLMHWRNGDNTFKWNGVIYSTKREDNRTIEDAVGKSLKNQVNKNVIPTYVGTFHEAFIKANKDLGTGSNIYFKWNNNIYTTELGP